MISVVVCDRNYLPMGEVSAEAAVKLLFTGRAEPVYTAQGLEVVTSFGLAPSPTPWADRFRDLIQDGRFLVPGIIRLIQAVARFVRVARPNRVGILKRDRNRCQYCGTGACRMTLDHVFPQSRGGKDTWENLVAACGPCNTKKADRTPDEAGMPLAKKPTVPSINVINYDRFNRLLFS